MLAGCVEEWCPVRGSAVVLLLTAAHSAGAEARAAPVRGA